MNKKHLLILGLDIATTTGWALYSSGESLSTIRTGTTKAQGNGAEEKAASLAINLLAMLKQNKPDFVAIEEPMRNVMSFKKKTNTIFSIDFNQNEPFDNNLIASIQNRIAKISQLANQLADMEKLLRESADRFTLEKAISIILKLNSAIEQLVGKDETTINPNALQLSSMTGAAVAIISAYRIPWITIPSATWRKHFLGKGREKGWQRADWKKAAIERCRLLKIDVKNNDAAEAVGVAFTASASPQFKMLEDRLFQGVAA